LTKSSGVVRIRSSGVVRGEARVRKKRRLLTLRQFEGILEIFFLDNLELLHYSLDLAT